MKYAVMSDVHANPKALETALADARGRGCRKFVFLGDVTGYGYDVKAALRIVRESFDVALMGNHDSACLGMEPWFEVQTNKNYRVDLMHRSILSDEEKEWLRSRPYEFSEGDALFVHGDCTNPRNWNYILGAEAVAMNLLACPKPLLFCGHSHFAAVWEMVGGPADGGEMKCGAKLQKYFSSPAKRHADTQSFKVLDNGRYIVNVGSVGYPRNDLCSTYVIYDSSARRVTFRRLPVDLFAYAAEIAACRIQIPLWLRDALDRGAVEEKAGGRN